MRLFYKVFLMVLITGLFSTGLTAQESIKGEGMVSVSPSEFHLPLYYSGLVNLNVNNIGGCTQNINAIEEVLQGDGSGWPIPPTTFFLNGGESLTMNINVDSVDIQNPTEPYKKITINAQPADTTIYIYVYKGILYGGITDSEITHITMFPNPVSDILYLKDLNKARIVRVFDLKGNLLCEQYPEGSDIQIDMTDYPLGLYLLEADDGNRKISKKIIKR